MSSQASSTRQGDARSLDQPTAPDDATPLHLHSTHMVWRPCHRLCVAPARPRTPLSIVIRSFRNSWWRWRAAVQFGDNLEATSKAANTQAVHGRGSAGLSGGQDRHCRGRAFQRLNRDFSSMHSTSARSGGSEYRSTVSRTLSMMCGSAGQLPDLLQWLASERPPALGDRSLAHLGHPGHRPGRPISVGIRWWLLQGP